MAGGSTDPGPAPEEPRDADDPTGPPRTPPAGGPPPDREQDPGGRPDDDAAWEAIVANFGERATLDEPTTGGTAGDGSRDDPAGDDPAGDDPARLRRLFEPFDRPAPRAGEGRDPAARPDDPEADLGKAPDDRFVPPPPPPVPATTPDRRAAWAGVIGGPALLLVALLLGLALPEVVVLALVAGFVGGFVYLVLKMPREPRDPGDDGARV